MKSWLSRFASLIGLAFVFVLFTVLQPAKFPAAENIEIMLLQTSVVGTMALGMTLVIISGGIDLSVGSVVALTTVIIALLLNAGMGPLAAASGGILAGATCGFLTGSAITRAKLPPFIVTLGMWGAIRGAAKGLANEQMVVAPGTWLNKLLNPLTQSQSWMLFPPGVWMTVCLAFVVALFLNTTKAGRHLTAIGSNEEASHLSGVPVNRTKTMVYVLGSMFAALGGVLQFSYLTVGDPTTANGMELDTIAAVVIGGGSLAGGRGSVSGSLIGALIMTVIGNGCTKMDLPNWVQEIVTGLIIVVAVLLDRLRHRRKG